jgi:ribosomal-protein-alanine N-acetyltransferase
MYVVVLDVGTSSMRGILADEQGRFLALKQINYCPRYVTDRWIEQDAADFIGHCIKGEGQGQICRAVCADEEPVGSIAVFLGQDVYRRSAELGYWLAEPFWGKGIMSQAVAQICREAFERFDIVRIYAEPYAHNQGSRRVLEKAGFALEGILRQSVYKNGQMHDSCIYALVK